jgi:hypothetical protein
VDKFDKFFNDRQSSTSLGNIKQPNSPDYYKRHENKHMKGIGKDVADYAKKSGNTSERKIDNIKKRGGQTALAPQDVQYVQKTYVLDLPQLGQSKQLGNTGVTITNNNNTYFISK